MAAGKAKARTVWRYFFQLQRVLFLIMENAGAIVDYDAELAHNAAADQDYQIVLTPGQQRSIRRRAAPLVKLAKKILGQPRA